MPLVIEIKELLDGDLALTKRTGRGCSRIAESHPIVIKILRSRNATALGELAPEILADRRDERLMNMATANASRRSGSMRWRNLLHFTESLPDFTSSEGRGSRQRSSYLCRNGAVGLPLMSWHGAHARRAAEGGHARRPDGLRGSPLERSGQRRFWPSASHLAQAVPAGAWNACANPDALADAGLAASPLQLLRRWNQIATTSSFPMHFLTVLEESRCTGGRSGWSPALSRRRRRRRRLSPPPPSFLKSHSQGEHGVFDHSWADAYERAGGATTPSSRSRPFTPATGPRLLVADGPRADEARQALIAGQEALRGQTHSSSVHVTFAQEPDIAALKRGWLSGAQRTCSFTGAMKASAPMTISSAPGSRMRARR